MDHKKKEYRMKTTVTISVLVLVLSLIHITCQSPVNPYADPEKARVVVRDMSFSADEVSIFSNQEFTLVLEYPVHIKKICIESDDEIITRRKGICISPDTLTTNPLRCNFYAVDTGSFSMDITTYFQDGTTEDTSLSIRAFSPLGQEDISGDEGDTVSLRTEPVDNQVTYIWDMGEDFITESDQHDVRVRLDSLMNDTGYLYIREGDDGAESPRYPFLIAVGTPDDNPDTPDDTTDTPDDTTDTPDDTTDTPEDTTETSIDTTAAVIDSILCEGNPLSGTFFVAESTVVLSIFAHDAETTITAVYINEAEAELEDGAYIVEFQPDHSMESADTVRVVNAVGLESTRIIEVIYNNKPEISSLPAQAFYVDEESMVTLDVEDEDDDSLIFRGMVTHGDGTTDTLSFTEDGEFSFTPNLSDTGDEASVTFSITDGFETITADYVPEVLRRDKPRIDSILVNGRVIPETLFVDEQTVTVDIYTHDPDTTIRAVYMNGNEVEKTDGAYSFELEPAHSLEVQDSIRVVNEVDRETIKTIRIVYNRKPHVTEIASGVTYAGEDATGSIEVEDGDDDDLTITAEITHGDNSTDELTISENGEFSWIPDSSDTGGQATIRFTITDGFESIDTSFTPDVQFRPILKFTSTADDFQSTLMRGLDVLTLRLHTDVYPEESTVSYAAKVLETEEVIQELSEGSEMSWTPQETGEFTIECVATATNDLADTLLIPVTVIPIPTPEILSIVSGGEPVADGSTVEYREFTLTVNTTYNYSGHSVTINGEAAEQSSDSTFTSTLMLDHAPNDIEVALNFDEEIADDSAFTITQNVLPKFTTFPPDLDTIVAGSRFSAPLLAEDKDDDILMYDVELADYSAMQPVSYADGKIHFNFNRFHIGHSYTLDVSVSDGFGSLDTSFLITVVDEADVEFTVTEDDIPDSLLFYQDSISLTLAANSSGPDDPVFWVFRNDLETGMQDTLLFPDTVDQFSWRPTIDTDTGWNELVFHVEAGNASDSFKAEVYVEPLTVEFLEDTSYVDSMHFNHLVPVRILKNVGDCPYWKISYRLTEETTLDPSFYNHNSQIDYIRVEDRADAWMWISNYQDEQVGKIIVLEMTDVLEGAVKFGEKIRHTIILDQIPQN